jgi:hypothetical protein
MDHESTQRVKRAWLRHVAARLSADIDADPDSQQADAAERVLDAWRQRQHQTKPSHETYMRFVIREARKAGDFNCADVAELVEADHTNERA